MKRLNISWLLIANFFNRGLTIGTQLLVGSLLLPEQVGVFAVAAGVANIISPFQSGDHGRIALQDRQDPAGTAARLRSWLLAGSMVSWLVAVGIVPMLGLGVSIAPLACLAALSFPRIMGNVRIALLAGAGRSSAVAMANVSDGLARSLALVTSAYLGAGMWSLVFGEAAAALASLAVLVHLCPGPAPGGFALPRPIFRKLMATLAVCLLIGIELNCSAVAIGHFCSIADAGNFAFANRIAAQVTALVLPLITLEMVPRLIMARVQRQRFQEVSRSEIARLLMIIVPMVALIIGVAPMAIQWIWHDKWREAAGLLRWLGLSIGLRMAYAISKAHLEAMGSFRGIFSLSALDTGLILTAVVLAGYFGTAHTVVQALASEAGLILILSVFMVLRRVSTLPVPALPLEGSDVVPIGHRRTEA